MKPADPRWRRAAIAKGNRRATAYGDEARGPQHTGHQQTDRLRQEDGEEVSSETGDGATLRPASEAAEQTGHTQAVLAGSDEGGCVECPGATARATEARLPGRLYDFEGLAASATNRWDGNRVGGGVIRDRCSYGIDKIQKTLRWSDVGGRR